MLIPFCSKIKVAGRGLAQGFGGKYYPQVWRFSGQTFRHRPWESQKPRTTFADKKGTASVFFVSHIVEHWKGSESATPIVENRKGGYLEM
ncbi:MAG: hypothetical protein SOX84_00905 [Prevotella sp.]|nr:hypothetical protein [Prevotella sp.]MDY4217338.1 hypothetical protein [Prevotella sp.]